MKCDEIEGRLAELVAGESRDPDVEAHLLDCAACRRDCETARAGWEAAAALPAPAPSALLVERVRRKVASSRGGPLKFATGLAAAVLAGLIVFQAVPVPRARPAAVAPPSRNEPVLASFEPDPGVGALVARDLEGRPVGELSVARQTVRVEILDGVARTEIEEVFLNHTPRRLEGTFYFPLPPNASISRLAMEINGKLMEGSVVERERAREIYEGIVRRLQDPALLEWMPGGLFKCRIFPIEPHSEKRIVLAYTQALPCRGGRMKYVYPLASEKAREHALAQVSIDVAVRFAAKLKSIRSASHAIDVEKKDAHEARGRFEARNLRPTNDFVIDLELEGGEAFVALPHKIDGEDGWFLAACTPPGEARRTKSRKYAIVLDISASVSRPELDAQRRLVEEILERVPEFVLLAHHVEVQRFAGDRRAALDWLAKLECAGGSDVKAAFEAAIAEKPDEIVYVGEGVPTVGEERIDLRFDGTIRTVAVGSDAAAAALEALAFRHGGVSFAFSPSDHVPTRAREIADGIVAEVIRDVAVEATEEIYDLAPRGRRNLLAGERLIVTGRWRGAEGTLSIGGRDFKVAFPASEERNGYVKRLWAQRKIADLLTDESKKAEVIALSIRYQIMTPYTSFLVLETEEDYRKHLIERMNKEIETLEMERQESQTKEPARTEEEGRKLDEWSRDPREREGKSNWVSDFRGYAQEFHDSDNGLRLNTVNPDPTGVDRLRTDKQRGGVEVRARVLTVAAQAPEVTIDAGSKRGVREGMLFAISRGGKFVAVIVVKSVGPDSSSGGIWQGISLGPIRAGDEAQLIDDPAAFLARLPADVRNNVLSLKNLERVGKLVEYERSTER